MKRITMTMVMAAIFAVSASGQSFLNLNFESAQNLPGDPGIGVLIPVTNALPNWTAFDAGLALSEIYYVSNNADGVSSSVELEGGSLAIGGNYSVGLYLESSISQKGLVPDGAESLQFEAQGPGPGGSLEGTDLAVTMGGQNLSFAAISQGSDYTVYGANIPTGMDGQMEALTFGCEGIGSGNVLLDNIEFSTSSVPEPGEWWLIGVGAVLFGVFRRRRKRRILSANSAN